MKRREVIFSAEAEKDFATIADWYREIRLGLDLEFILCLEIELESIKRNPLQYPEFRKDIRRTVMHRFPYKIYFTADTDIVILGIIHHKRSNKYLRKKLTRK